MRIPVLLALLAHATALFATDLDAALLIQGVYDGHCPQGWHAYSPGQLDARGVNAALLRKSEEWRGEVYERGDEVVLAWAGNRGGDEGLVIAQEIGLPMPEFLEAAEVGRQVVTAFKGKNVSFAGHSMGGGFASAAAVATGKDAVLFNAQGLHRNTIQAIGGPGPGNVKAYSVLFDYATMLQSLPFLPKAMGTKILLPNLGWDPGIAHNIDKVIQSMESIGIR